MRYIGLSGSWCLIRPSYRLCFRWAEESRGYCIKARWLLKLGRSSGNNWNSRGMFAGLKSEFSLSGLRSCTEDVMEMFLKLLTK